ncbi:MAG: Co2+/Mg2+ efflux protein ApaG [Brevundimonas sp.]|jgi:ApaG protein|uniref:Co2+/Mg2+ efflux protein ApaG n=1 Tax=Brevundimonas sp. TaxID=1871086 RepID=UPI002732A132|nr:Co2+/Mg2+ efflux protein ApaG [Brevundimonas sp.]MDP3379836.1 Co2+/Mg2+ efflux protein ApaG [Brevundimonas sp.]
MYESAAYTAETRGVRVKVQPSYLAGRSNPDEGLWVWAYQIEIVNLTGVPVQLLSRHWIITDASGREEVVIGDGVVGEQPVIAPGDSHSYASGCPLPTPSGAMRGSYVMETPDGERFEAEIPAFSLDVPGARTLN